MHPDTQFADEMIEIADELNALIQRVAEIETQLQDEYAIRQVKFVRKMGVDLVQRMLRADMVIEEGKEELWKQKLKDRDARQMEEIVAAKLDEKLDELHRKKGHERKSKRERTYSIVKRPRSTPNSNRQ